MPTIPALLGYAPEELVGTSIFSIVHLDASKKRLADSPR